MTTPILAIEELTQSNSNPYSIVNEALRRIEATTVRIISHTITAQPSAPADGDAYIIPTGATGTDWSVYTVGSIAFYSAGIWRSLAPKSGVLIGTAEGVLLQYIGSVWIDKTPSTVQNNYTATTDPTVNDDSSAGYQINSGWINTSTAEFFRCLNPAVGAAIWAKTTLTIDELGTAASANTGTGPSDVPTTTQADSRYALKSETGGIGQTWQNVTASRALNTVYTNSTGKPIHVNIRALNNTNVDRAYLIINSTESIYGTDAPTSNAFAAYAEVPAGATYKAMTDNGGSVILWEELR